MITFEFFKVDDSHGSRRHDFYGDQPVLTGLSYGQRTLNGQFFWFLFVLKHMDNFHGKGKEYTEPEGQALSKDIDFSS